MGKFKVDLLPAAYEDLDEIFDYILLDDPAAAESMLDRIMTSLHRLQDFPNSGVKLTARSLKYYDFRMVIVDPYVAFYRFIDGKVYIYRILHGARDYIRILKQLE
ncbi:MAG: type II toxin-antitoxin system RelE/ParE family toxin [Syntrophomonadaceae bacterium]|nr:type II toxin-antitoxin system RelE/ParE family toxin [Syntrophomonadaceae bacterium]MDD3890375.1 type II toxin-antitoxin system RelE/ParE family toxin [Syntrophomonadaceae bacterium]MDD4549057.1 type II toxin-antitoxin system RelE/ParE family toxin [Syntrophomonadaceae bacterium]